MFTLSGATSTCFLFDIIHMSILDYHVHLVHISFSGSPLSYHTLIVELTRNIYLKCIQIYIYFIEWK